MDIGEVYLRALQKSEQNLANGGIKLDRGRFVYLFNEAQDRLVRYYINRKDDETVKAIQFLLVYWRSLERKGRLDSPEATRFSLPDDFLWFSNVSGSFQKGECSATDFNMWDVKNENVHELLADENNRPSFDFRETFYSLGEDSIIVYEDGFNTEALRLTYYRKPRRVDISGYYRSDGSQSSDIDPELPDDIVIQVLDMMAKQFGLNEDNLNRYQFDKDNVNSFK